MTPNTKEALLEAAERLFTANGFNAVSTRDLAEAAGANLAAIKYHFGSKSKLFIEVVHRLMSQSGVVEARLDYHGSLTTPEEAARALGGYIYGFLHYLLNSGHPQACRMMLREACTDHSADPEMFETLISSVVEKFLRPLEESLVHAVQILCPELSKEEGIHAARSITGQCAYYGSHKIFLERIDGVSYDSEQELLSRASHIIKFSFSALGRPPALLESALSGISDAQQCIARECRELAKKI
jgi:TetR/AcrR family transcriptional regulator, regulator of cefoperazone and chloramphenicol sensitivity